MADKTQHPPVAPAKASQPAVATAKPTAAPAVKHFTCQLAGHPSLVIEAADEAAAKVEYFRNIGVRHSQHAFTAAPAPEG